MFKKIYLIFIVAMFLGCATVPKESVTLSATVGRDLQEMQRSHLALVDLYFNGLIEDINRFIDDVYLPYQIKMTLSDEFWKEEMLAAIELASLDNSDSEIQKESFQKIQIFIQSIQSEVEYYRNLKISPIEAQYEQIVHSINTSYEQIHYANSIVTGHLASVVKVHDTQNELIEKVKLSDLRNDVAKSTSILSKEIDKLLKEAESGEKQLDEIIQAFEEIIN